MKKFHLTILGSNAAGPAYGRITTCQYLIYNKSAFLIDCGEACQIRISEYKLKANKIETICISHLHGDHCFGLPGLLTSYSNASRSKALCIIGPKGIKKFVEDIMTNTFSRITYEISYIELDHDDGLQKVHEDQHIKVLAFPLKHRIPTYGYRFQEKQIQLNIKKDAILQFQLTIDEIKRIKSGQDVIREDGQKILWKNCCINPSLPRSYSFCSDTIYDPDICQYIANSQYLYHEATYTHELVHLAKERMHSTALEAGKIALESKADNLIIGHYSSRYRNVETLIEEAASVFHSVHKGYDGFMLEFPKRFAKF